MNVTLPIKFQGRLNTYNIDLKSPYLENFQESKILEKARNHGCNFLKNESSVQAIAYKI